MCNGVEIPCGIKSANPKPFLTGAFKAGIVAFGFGSESVDFLERDTITINGKPVIIGQSNIFCAASVFLTIVPLFMITRTFGAL